MAAIALAFLAVWFAAAAVRTIRGVALAALPCLAVTFLGSVLYLHAQTPLPADPPLAKRLAGTPPVRVLWILFDEWDQRMTFQDRAPGTVLPVIDNLGARSFTGSRALAVQAGRTPVGGMSTFISIPSLLYGRFIAGAVAEDARTMRIEFAPRGPGVFSAGDSTVFGDGDSVFARVRARGWNAALAGWYLPFCRALGGQVTDCYWDTRYLQTYSARQELAGGRSG